MKQVAGKLEIVKHALEEVFEKAAALEDLEHEHIRTNIPTAEELALAKQQVYEGILKIRDGLTLISETIAL